MNPLRRQFRKKDFQNRATHEQELVLKKKKVFKDCARQEAGGIRATEGDRKTETSGGAITDTQRSLRAGWPLTLLLLSALVLSSWPQVWLGLGWKWCPPLLSPADQSTSHCCISTGQWNNPVVTQKFSCKMCWHGSSLIIKAVICKYSHVIILTLKASHLFYVQKVFGFKVNSGTLDWTIFIKGPTVTHIGFHCECYWFRLLKGKEGKKYKLDIWQYTVSLPLYHTKHQSFTHNKIKLVNWKATSEY